MALKCSRHRLRINRARAATKSMVESGIEAAILAIKLGLATSASPINIKNPLSELYVKKLINPALLLDPKSLSKEFLVQATDNTGFPFRHFGHPFTDDSPWSGDPKDNVKLKFLPFCSH